MFDPKACASAPADAHDRTFWARGFEAYAYRYEAGMKRHDPQHGRILAAQRYFIQRAKRQFEAGWDAAAAVEAAHDRRRGVTP